MANNTSKDHGSSVISYAVSQSKHQPVVITIDAFPRRLSPLSSAIHQANKEVACKTR